MKNTKKGFTLVELLVVIAILAILSSVAVVGYTAFIEKADQSKADAELRQIITILNAEYAEEGEATVADAQAYVDALGLGNGVTVTVSDDNGTLKVSYSTGKATAEGKLLIETATSASGT